MLTLEPMTSASSTAAQSISTGVDEARATQLRAANINPRVSTEPSWVFGNRPVYIGLVECGLPDPRTATLPAGARR